MVRFAAAALALAVMINGVAANAAELVLLDFWSPTCPPCMQMKPTVEALINARYPIRKVDVSQERGVAQQFGVTGVPCFVMLVDGREVDRVVGFTSSERLQQMFTHAKEVVAEQRRIRGQSQDNPATAQPESGTAAPYAAASDTNPGSSPGSSALPPSDIGGSRQTSPTVPAEVQSTNAPFDNKLLSSSVRLTVDDANARSHGTGTIIDARKGQALVITCGHLFRDTKGKAPVTVELFEVGADGVRVVENVQGQVLSYDLERDVAFVTIWPTKPVCVAQVAPPGTNLERNDSAASVGCSNGQDPTVMATRVTWLDRYQGPPNVETSGAPVVGRSGGGLFNTQGQLVGVCFAADYEGNKGLYAGLQSIHDELNRLGLREIYAKPVAGELTAAGSTEMGPMAQGPVVRGQVDENAPSTPQADSITIASQNGPTAIPENLTPTEQAGFEEILSRAATHEVVCIVRPKEAGGESEVIVLDDVSLEFIKALQAHRKGGEATTTR
jgi:thiol-disulfide isomerase/thioredoxin